MSAGPKRPHAVVCAKIVPRPEEVRFDPVTNNLDRTGARSEFNPPDLNAVEAALRIKDSCGGSVSILSMGPPFVLGFLEWTVRMGADHIYLLSDRKFAGSDTLATTYALAQAIGKLEPVDLVICGEESSDGATGQVPPGIAQWLGWPQATYAESLSLAGPRRLRAVREVADGHQVVESSLPAVASVKTGSNEPRFPDFGQTLGEREHVTIWSAGDLGLDERRIGQSGSPTTVDGTYPAPASERKREFLAPDARQAARVLAAKLREILEPG